VAVKIKFQFPMIRRPSRELDWPEGWPVPRIGEFVMLDDDERFKVERVTYYPIAGHFKPLIWISVT
jgi:hypothetical protein